MTGCRITIGLSLLCALVFSAFAASSASAAGTTLFECAKGAGAKDFKDADCSEAVTPGTGEFGHVAIAAKTSTKITITQTSAKTKIMGTIGGVTATLEATGYSSNATGENSERASKEMVAKGSGTGEFTGVTVVEGPEGCKLKGGTVKQLSTTSETVPAAMEMEFKPTTSFAEFTFESCKNAALNITYKVVGTFNGLPKGAFLEFTEASTKNLKFAGQPAFFIATYTVKMEGGNSLPLTTTTP